jgi:hypothetical protein
MHWSNIPLTIQHTIYPSRSKQGVKDPSKRMASYDS